MLGSSSVAAQLAASQEGLSATSEQVRGSLLKPKIRCSCLDYSGKNFGSKYNRVINHLILGKNHLKLRCSEIIRN
jgi:hypothetical protein